MEYQRYIHNRQIERTRKLLDGIDPDRYKKGPNDVTRFIKREVITKSKKCKFMLDEELIREEKNMTGSMRLQRILRMM